MSQTWARPVSKLTGRAVTSLLLLLHRICCKVKSGIDGKITSTRTEDAHSDPRPQQVRVRYFKTPVKCARFPSVYPKPFIRAKLAQRLAVELTLAAARIPPLNNKTNIISRNTKRL